MITGDKLGNYSSIEKIGKGLALPTALSKTKDHFIEKVYRYLLYSYGCTICISIIYIFGQRLKKRPNVLFPSMTVIHFVSVYY